MRARLLGLPSDMAADQSVCDSACCWLCAADDLPVLDPAAPAPPSGRWIVADTNVVLHQMDVLEHAAISHCIVLQTGARVCHYRSPI